MVVHTPNFPRSGLPAASRGVVALFGLIRWSAWFSVLYVWLRSTRDTVRLGTATWQPSHVEGAIQANAIVFVWVGSVGAETFGDGGHADVAAFG